MEERTGAQLELQSTAGELARREERLVGRLDEVATLLDGVSGKVDALVAKNARELEHVLAAMLKGKHEREAMARAHQTECDALWRGCNLCSSTRWPHAAVEYPHSPARCTLEWIRCVRPSLPR